MSPASGALAPLPSARTPVALALGATEPALTPASAPPARARLAARQRLLLIDAARDALADHRIADLPALLTPGDLLVVNDAATVPASLRVLAPAGVHELRLAGELAPGLWRAVLFGPGDWRTPTERRPAPPALGPGTGLELRGGLAATIEAVEPVSPRLVQVRFAGPPEALWPALFAHGHAVQYAHAPAPVALEAVQSPFAGRPWAVEVPSAARGLRHAVLRALRARGVALAAVTHAAGLSATGDEALDRALPLPERFEVPLATVAGIEAARARGGRVIAAGTSATRALESAARAGALRAGGGVTDLRIGPAHALQVVDGLITGLHEPGTSHRGLMEAFAPAGLLRRAMLHAARAGYLAHEQGDVALILAR